MYVDTGIAVNVCMCFEHRSVCGSARVLVPWAVLHLFAGQGTWAVTRREQWRQKVTLAALRCYRCFKEAYVSAQGAGAVLAGNFQAGS